LSERKTRKHPQYTIEQKKEILTTYFNKEVSRSQLEKQFDMGHSVFKNWVKQYREFGTTVDNRGRGTKKEIPSKGRPKKMDFESMSKEDLLKYIKSGEEIKKALAYLKKQSKNIKS
jgi:transposase-like protein